MYSNRLFLILLIASLPLMGNAQELPLGYKAYYQKTPAAFIPTLALSKQANWQTSRDKRYNLLTTQPADTADNTLPQSRGFIAGQIYGEYILEFEVRMLQSCSDSNGFYFLSAAKNCNTFYTFCFTGDSVHFSYVLNGVRSSVVSQTFKLPSQQWKKIRIENDILTRNTIISTTDGKQQVTFNDRRRVMGYVGFGTQGVNNHLRNVCIWAPTTISERSITCE